jgi:hypothetical protein
LNLPHFSKTLYARMFFRKRFWYTNPQQLKTYSESDSDLRAGLKELHAKSFLKTEEDAVYESDFEKIQELFECM